jgi:hypothetical protein
MPKPKGCQLSGATKRRLAKEKVDKERSAVASAPRLDRFLVHVHAKITTQSDSQSIHHKSSDSESEDGQQQQSQSVTEQGYDQCGLMFDVWTGQFCNYVTNSAVLCNECKPTISKFLRDLKSRNKS